MLSHRYKIQCRVESKLYVLVCGRRRACSRCVLGHGVAGLLVTVVVTVVVTGADGKGLMRTPRARRFAADYYGP